MDRRVRVLWAAAMLAACGGEPAATTAGSTTAAHAGGGGSGGAGAEGGMAASGGGGGEGGGGAGGGGHTEIGSLSGRCGELDPHELTPGSPAFAIENELDFGMMAMAEPDPNALEPSTKAVYDAGNLGGSSLWSEVFAYDVLRRCELASLLKTEGEIAYLDPGGKKTDLLVEIDGATIGVSVTRAYHFPPTEPYTVGEAQALLEGKLGDILLSSANVDPVDAWQKQILHVIAYDPQYAAQVMQAYAAIDPGIVSDTIVVVTVTGGDDAFLY